MSSRPETGPMKFGDDWTGVFVRGDYARPMAFMLNRLLQMAETQPLMSPIEIVSLRDLVAVLEGSDELGERAGLQRMKAFDECLADVAQ